MGSRIESFEELECWKESRTLVKMIYQATQLNPFAKDFGLRDQIQRAAVSVMANIAEGFHTFSNLEFIRFLGYSHRSCAEVISHLYVALDLNYMGQETFNELKQQATSCLALVKGFIKYLKKT